jgi:hypothetical protein
MRSIAVFSASLSILVSVSSAALAQAAANAGTCSSASSSQVITQVVSAQPGNVLGIFVCIADLDGTGKQEVIVGKQQLFSNGTSAGNVKIITNTGAVRKEIAW